MNSLKTFEQLDPANSLSKNQIDFLNKFVDGSWNLVNGFVDIDGDFQWTDANGKDFKGIKFGKVLWNFNCFGNRLTSLEGAPQDVGGNFNCANNQLTSLDGGPQDVGNNFDCSGNELTSLAGGPKKVGNNFGCSNNLLTSLSGSSQKVGGSFYCIRNKLTSLEGAPQEVGKDFNCTGNNLISLEGCPQKIGGNFYCGENLISRETFQLLWNKLKEIPIYSIALASIWSKIPEKEQDLMKKDLDPDYLDYSQLSDFGLI